MKKERVWKVSEGQALSTPSCGTFEKVQEWMEKLLPSVPWFPAGMIPEPWRQSRRGQSSCADRN